MKPIADMLERLKPHFEKGGRLQSIKPVFQAMDAALFAHSEPTEHAPYARDPVDIKRYMTMVIVALTPAFLASLYFFGPRILLLYMISYAAGGAVEVLFAVVRKKEIHEGFLVTGFIYPLILPPGIPLWMAAAGIVFGVIVGKEIFGGTGRNLFNAALVGRCFLAFSYPASMTGAWIEPGPANWLRLPAALMATPVNAVTSATPLVLARSGDLTPSVNLFFGNIMGSAGETSALAILLGAGFLLAVRVANWRTITGGMLAMAAAAGILHATTPAQVAPPLFQFLAGGWLFGIVFMATDPVTSPVTLAGKWAYGILIGVLTVLIRSFSGFVEGVTFAILFGNICAPLIDECVIRLRVAQYAKEKVRS